MKIIEIKRYGGTETILLPSHKTYGKKNTTEHNTTLAHLTAKRRVIAFNCLWGVSATERYHFFLFF